MTVGKVSVELEGSFLWYNSQVFLGTSDKFSLRVQLYFAMLWDSRQAVFGTASLFWIQRAMFFFISGKFYLVEQGSFFLGGRAGHFWDIRPVFFWTAGQFPCKHKAR